MIYGSGSPKAASRIRGLFAGAFAENREDEQPQLAADASAILCEGLPGAAEIVRHGESWQVLSNTFTALTAIPTTVAAKRLWNGEPAGGRMIVIDSVCVVKVLIDVTTNDLFSVFAQNVRMPVTAPTDDATVARSLSARNTYDGKARKDEGVASSAVTGRWDHIGTSAQQAAAIAGSAWQTLDIPLAGKYIIPPGGSFGVHVAEVTATANAFRACIRWHEVRFPVVS